MNGSDLLENINDIDSRLLIGNVALMYFINK